MTNKCIVLGCGQALLERGHQLLEILGQQGPAVNPQSWERPDAVDAIGIRK